MAQSADRGKSPARVGGPSPVVLVPVITMVDYQPPFVESQERGAGESDVLTILGPTRPPLDRGPVWARYRLPNQHSMLSSSLSVLVR